MRIFIIFTLLLTLAACGEVPQDELDGVRDHIQILKEHGAESDVPDEFRKLQNSFADVEKLVAEQKEKTFGSFTQARSQLEQMEQQIELISFQLDSKMQQVRDLMEKYPRECGVVMYMYSRLSDQERRKLSPQFKQELNDVGNALSAVAKQMMGERSRKAMLEILTLRLGQAAKLQQQLRPLLSDEEYEACLKDVQKKRPDRLR